MQLLPIELHDQRQGLLSLRWPEGARDLRHTVSVRKEPLETATLAVLQGYLLTEEDAKLFVEEFRREATRLARGDERQDETASVRLRQIEAELANLYQNLLAGLASPVLRMMIEEREAEKAKLETRLQPLISQRHTADILPHPELLERFAAKVRALRTSLDDNAIRSEAAEPH